MTDFGTFSWSVSHCIYKVKWFPFKVCWFYTKRSCFLGPLACFTNNKYSLKYIFGNCFEVFIYLKGDLRWQPRLTNAGLLKPVGVGGPALQILADYLALSYSEDRLCLLPPAPPPEFSDLPTALKCIEKCCDNISCQNMSKIAQSDGHVFIKVSVNTTP